MILVAFLFLLALQCASATIKLECDFSTDREWAVVGHAYTCHAKFIQIDDARNISAVLGTHQSGMSHQNVTGLFVNTEPIDFIPEGIELFFENLEFMYIRYTPIRSLTKDDLKPFPKLKIFGVIGGQLTTLSGDVYKYLPDLEYVSASNNSITNVGPGLFDHSPLLTTVYLQDNLCIDMQAVNNATNVDDIARELAFRCPPTIEMTEKIILEGENFRDAVMFQLEPEFQIFNDRVKQLEEENRSAAERIQQLENFILNLCTTYDVCCVVGSVIES